MNDSPKQYNMLDRTGKTSHSGIQNSLKVATLHKAKSFNKKSVMKTNDNCQLQISMLY